MKYLLLPLAGAALLTGCASVSMVGYGDGWVKTSTVSYDFQGPPLLQDVSGQTYHTEVRGAEGPVAITALEQHGMRAAERGDLEVHVELGDVRQGEPGAMKLGKKWYPGFEVSVPYEVSFHRGGTLAERSGSYSNVLTFNQFPGFESREEAVGALGTVQKLATDGVERESLAAALGEATSTANDVARGLFQERNISMQVPIVRSAAGLDLEHAYTLLVDAEGPDGVRDALQTYESLGTEHRNEDGSPNNTANYGVACGVAACKLLLRDLAGAWSAAEEAAAFEPSGDEVAQIRTVIYEQERITGVRVIPEDQRQEIDRGMATAEALEGLLGALVD